eukprot:2641618-Rhodomonas_salina.1
MKVRDSWDRDLLRLLPEEKFPVCPPLFPIPAHPRSTRPPCMAFGQDLFAEHAVAMELQERNDDDQLIVPVRPCPCRPSALPLSLSSLSFAPRSILHPLCYSTPLSLSSSTCSTATGHGGASASGSSRSRA